MLTRLKKGYRSLYTVSKHVHSSACNLRFSGQSYRPPPKEKNITSDSNSTEINDENHFDSQDDVEETINFVKRVSFMPEMGHQAFVVQPVVKWGRQKITGTTPDLQIQEAVALAETLPNWKIVQTKIISVKNMKTIKIFGRGNLEMLKETIDNDHRITALFISANMLNGMQHRFLENYFQVPVFDRFTIVLKIFKDHAHTKEAMLQVALAEIPYLRVRLREMHEENKEWHSADMVHIGGSGKTFIDTRKQLLLDREIKIKKVLDKLKQHRKLMKKIRIAKQIPIIAVVGYTNAGKTSLIKAFTNEKRLIPKDQLFATLDVTAHAGRLPCNLKVIFMDTVGFIANIPTSLIASFNSTLEDIVLADLIIHVRDISHPDSEYQKENVLQTLKNLNLPSRLMDTMIEANNKVDLCELPVGEEAFNISITEGTGLTKLHDEIEKRILVNTDQISRLFRVKIGSEEERWLHRECGVQEIEIDDERQNHYKLKVVMSKLLFSKFCHEFKVRKVIKGS